MYNMPYKRSNRKFSGGIRTGKEIIMAINMYRVFYEVAKRNSFAEAAEVLHLTPSAVSHSIAALEEEFGFRLFSRSRAGVVLTAPGEKMLVRVRQLLKEERSIHEEALRIRGLEQGMITVGTFSSVLFTWLVELIDQFYVQYPGIEIHVLQGDYEDVEHWVRNGEADLGISISPLENVFNEIPLCRDRLLCAAWKSFLPENRTFITPSEMRKFELIARRSGYNKDAEPFTKVWFRGKDPKYLADDDRAIFSMVENQLGIAVLPELTLQHIGFSVSLWPIEPAAYRNIALISRKDREPSPAASAFSQMLQTYVREWGTRTCSTGQSEKDKG